MSRSIAATVALVLALWCHCPVAAIGPGTGMKAAACGYQHCLQANNSQSFLRVLKQAQGLARHTSVEILLKAGKYRLSDNKLLTFTNWSNVSFVGESQKGTVLECGDGVGMVFRNSTGVSMRTLTIAHCSRLLNTTSVNITRDSASQEGGSQEGASQEGASQEGASQEGASQEGASQEGASQEGASQEGASQEGASQEGASQEGASQGDVKFVLSKTGVLFDRCSDVTLLDVKVFNCSGMGVTIYNTRGSNAIRYSHFESNHLNAGDYYPGGGGVVIETSYCVPGDASCGRDSWTGFQISDSSYVIEHCNFFTNRATSHYLLFDSVYPHAWNHMGLGQGGGLSLTFKGRAYRNRAVVNNCTFLTNRAEWGGAMYVSLGDISVGNTIVIDNSTFSRNNYRDSSELDFANVTVGGALRIQLVSYPPDERVWPGYTSNVTANTINITRTAFFANYATWGGAVSFVTTRNLPGQSSPNSLHIQECSFEENQARVAASAVDVRSWKPDIVDSKEPFMQPVIQNCNFSYNEMVFLNITAYSMGVGALYITTVPALFVGANLFSFNKGTAMVVSGTFVSVSNSSSMTFTQNSGRRGGALAFFGNSWLIAHEDTRFIFSDNSVGSYGLGGAIYSVHFGGHDMPYDYDCFFRYHIYNKPPSEWNTSVVFRGNIADHKPNSIYTTSSLPCAWHATNTLNADPHEGGAFCENSTWLFEGEERNCTNEIDTGPGEVTVTKLHLEVVPGWDFPLGISTRNDFGNLVPTVLTASPSREEDRVNIGVASSTSYISDDKIVLHGKEDQSGLLLLTTLDPRVVASEVNVTILSCPPGFSRVLCNDSTGMTCDCTCTDTPGIHCDNATRKAYLMQQYCISYGHNRSSIVVASCPYNQEKTKVELSALRDDQLEENVCKQYNRRGFLCSQCLDGFGVSVNTYSYKCVKCQRRDRYNWALFLLIELGPITIVCFLVILFGVSVSASSMNAFVFFSQVVSITFNENTYIWFFGAEYVNSAFSSIIFTLYGVWNLEFLKNVLPPICLDDGLKTLHIIVIGYVKALYPMLLLCICYLCIQLYDRNFRLLHILWRPFRYCRRAVYRNSQPQTSIVDAFATLIILSYSKFMYVSFPLVTLTSVYEINSNSTAVDLIPYHYYFDPDEVLHHSMANVVYFILGVVVLVVFVGVPPIFLILFPLKAVQACLSKVSFRLQIRLRTFADSFMGAFRDGTRGGRDCRMFAGVYLIFRVVFLAVNAAIIERMTAYLVQQVLCSLVIFFFALVRPYKVEFYNHLDTAFFALLAVLNSLSFYNSYQVDIHGTILRSVFYINYTLLLLPLVYLIVLILHNILSWRGSLPQFPRRLLMSKDVMEEQDTPTHIKTGANELMTNEESGDKYLPDRLVHPLDYSTLNHPSSLRPSDKRECGTEDSQRRQRPNTDESPLLQNHHHRHTHRYDGNVQCEGHGNTA